MSETVVLGLVRGSLPPAARRRAEDHLAECADCRSLVSELARLDPDTEEPPTGTGRQQRPAWRVWLVAASLLVLAVLVAAFARVDPTGPRPVAAVLPPTLAVLDPIELGDDPQSSWRPTALAELVRVALAEPGGANVVSGDATAHAIHELVQAQPAARAQLDVAALRARLDVDVVVRGVLRADHGRALRWELTLETSERSETIAVDGSDERLLALAVEAGDRLRRALGRAHVAPSLLARLRAQWPTAAALGAYAEGRARHRRGDERGARDCLVRAVAAAPRNGDARAALATVLRALGEPAQAAKEARAALALGDGAHLLAESEARLHEIAAEWPQAIAVWRRLHDAFPDEVGYTVELARVLCQGGRPDEALALVAVARPGTTAATAALRLAEARAALATGDAEHARRAAEAAAGAAEGIDAAALALAARRVQSAALERLGDLPAALATAEDACARARAVDDVAARVDAWLALGTLQARSGRVERAGVSFEQASALARDGGDAVRLGVALQDLAVARRE